MAVVEKDLLADLLERTPERTAPRPLTEVRPPAPQPPRRKNHTIKPVLSRSAMDPLKRPGLALLALVLWMVSCASTVIQMDNLAALFGLVLSPLTLLAIGLLIAGTLSVAEILTSESWWYMLPLIIDIGFTLWWSWPAFEHAARSIGAPLWSALVAGVVLGIISAWVPERIVFGARRK